MRFISPTLLSLVLVTLWFSGTTYAQVHSPPFQDADVAQLALRSTSDFLTEPQLVARVRLGAGSASAESIVTALVGEEGTCTNFRVMKAFSNAEAMVTFEWQPTSPTQLVTPGAASDASRAALERAYATLQASDSIIWVEPVIRDFFLTAVPNDPYFSSSGTWGQAYGDLWGLHLINAPLAWDTTTGAEDLLIAVVDSGVDYTHADLHRNIWVNPAEVPDNNTDGDIDVDDIDTNMDGSLSVAEINAVENGIDDGLAGHTPNGLVDDIFGYDFRDEDNDPRDFFGHGTHIAGTIGATGNDGMGVVGVNWQCKILAANGFNGNASATSVALASSLMYAADAGARVINCSWGSLVQSDAVVDAIEYAHAAGSAVVFASGNFGIDSQFVFPQSNRTITVNASTHLDTFTVFSNFGIRSDVAAPGGGTSDDPFEARNVLSTLASPSFFSSDLGDFHVGSTHIRLAGTSMAAPHAVGVLGLGYALNPTWSPEEARQALRTSAADHGATGWDPDFGYGRVDAAAILTVTAPCECHITSPRSGIRRDQLQDPTQLLLEGTARSLTDPSTSYRVDYRNSSSSTWTQIVDWTATAVVEGLLATWDTTTLTEGVYEIRVQVQDSLARIFEDRIGFAVPNPPMPGWPIQYSNESNHFGSPVVADLTGDGTAEIIATMGNELFVLDAAAQPKLGWPQTTQSFGPTGPFRGTPVIGDFDPVYPGLEIVTTHWSSSGGTTYNVNVFHWDGTRRTDANWPVQASGSGGAGQQTSPALADLDGDGDLELIRLLVESHSNL